MNVAMGILTYGTSSAGGLITSGAVLIMLSLLHWRVPHLIVTKDALIFPHRWWGFRFDIPEGSRLKVKYPNLYIVAPDGSSERIPPRLPGLLNRKDLAELRTRYS